MNGPNTLQVVGTFGKDDINRQYIVGKDGKARSLINQMCLGDLALETWIYELQRLLQDYPVTRLIEIVREEGLMNEFKALLTSQYTKWVKSYIRESLSSDDERDFANRMDDDPLRWFFFALTAIKDEGTAEHCVDTYGIARRTLPHISSLEGLSEDLKSLLLKAAALHDHGKTEVPTVALLNPFTWAQLQAIFIADLADPRRRHPVLVPVPLNHDEEEKFGPLVRGESHDPALAREYYHSLYRPRGGDHRNMPLRFVFMVARHILRNGDFPDIVKQFLDSKDGITPDIVQALSAQEEALAHIDAVLSLFRQRDHELDGWKTTFYETLGLHEEGSARLLLLDGMGETVNGVHHRLARLVADHHGYPKTRERMPDEIRAVDIGERAQDLTDFLRLIDVVAALGQRGRAYRRNSKTLRDTRFVLSKEAEAGKYPQALVGEFSRKLLEGPDDSQEVLRIVHENAARLAGTLAEV